MARHMGAGIKAWGISNTLGSKSGGAFARSVRMNPKNPKDQRMTAGFRADQVDEKTARVFYSLGDRHGITSAAERQEIIEKYLGEYAASLASRFRVTFGGIGEQQYITVTELPNPAVADTLMRAAEALVKLGDHHAAAHLLDWAEKDGNGEDW